MTLAHFEPWLRATQIEPTFARYPALLRAEVLVVPPRLGQVEPTPLLIFYGTSPRLDLDAALAALASGAHDPNLPPGLSLADLYAPILAAPGATQLPAVRFCAESFRGIQPDAETLDAFALYGAFERAAGGEICGQSLDAALAARIDRIASVASSE